jgi:transposase
MLDKYELRLEFSDLFGRKEMKWMSFLKFDAVDKAILESDLNLLKNIEEQSEFITLKIASLAKESAQVKLLMTLPGIEFYSAMLILAEIGDVGKFPEARKLCSWAGIIPNIHEPAGKGYVGKITRRGSKWLRWILVQAAQKAILKDERLGN